MSTLEQIGKRTPYKVPDGFFEKSSADIMALIEQEPAKAVRRRFFTSLRSYAAAAAAVAVLVVGSIFFMNDNRQVDLLDLTDEFSSLSVDDQASIIDIYESDIFLTR